MKIANLKKAPKTEKIFKKKNTSFTMPWEYIFTKEI